MEEPRGDETPRLIRRNLPFNQSKNVIQVIHSYGLKIAHLTRHDFFHVLLRLSTLKTIVLLVSLWTANVVFFAGIYTAVNVNASKTCGLGTDGAPVTFITAFAISVSTSVAGGYTFPMGSNAYFADCPGLLTAFYFQVGFSLVTNGIFIAVMIARLANSEKRAVQVLFSEKAIVSVTGGQVRFQVRVFDVNARHPVVGAHVRLYAMKKDKPVPSLLRLIQPNDELGSQLFLSLPQVICHHIDLYSVLHPPKPDNPVIRDKNGLTLREADSATCGREEVTCPICCETFGTHERWVRHVKYQKVLESSNEASHELEHRSIRQVELDLNRYKPTTNFEVLKSHFEQEICELFCVVEGTDPLTSGAFSALQSYKPTDIVWDPAAMFHPCISVDSDFYRVDLDRFHHIKRSGGRQHQASMRVHDSFFSDKAKNH